MENTFMPEEIATIAKEAAGMMGDIVTSLATIYEQRETALRCYERGDGLEQHSKVDANDPVRVALELINDVLDYSVVIDTWLKNQALAIELFLTRFDDLSPVIQSNGIDESTEAETAVDMQLRVADDAFNAANADWANMISTLRQLQTLLDELREQFSYREAPNNTQKIKALLQKIAPVDI